MRWRPKDRVTWHRWYAWHPVRTVYSEWVWLEWVWRSYKYHGLSTGKPTWAYRDTPL